MASGNSGLAAIRRGFSTSPGGGGRGLVRSKVEIDGRDLQVVGDLDGIAEPATDGGQLVQGPLQAGRRWSISGPPSAPRRVAQVPSQIPFHGGEAAKPPKRERPGASPAIL